MAQTYTFPNGFRLVYQKQANHMPISYINVFCHVGSANETPNTLGASHFVEHMCFKGTIMKPHYQDIISVYDSVGAYFNAHTVKQYTCFIVKCEDHCVDQCAKVLSDAMLHSIFNKTEYVKELDVVIEENVRNETDYSGMVNDHIDAMVYRGTVYEKPVDTLQFHVSKKTLQYDNVVDFYRTHYLPENMVFSICTSMPFSQVLRILENSYFAKRPKTIHVPPEPLLLLAPIHKEGVQWSIKHIPKMQAIYLAIGFRVCNMFEQEDVYGLMVLKHILGDTMSSRLFTLLREENGLTYKSNVSTTFYENAGCFSIFAITKSSKLMKNGKKPGVLPLIIGLLTDLVKHGITREELARAKHNLKATLHMSLENGNTLSYYNGLRVLLHKETDRVFPYTEIYAKYYAKMTVKKANALLGKYFKKDGMHVALLGSGIPSFTALNREVNEFER
jgi:predicted Zn-dependent peptidase